MLCTNKIYNKVSFLNKKSSYCSKFFGIFLGDQLDLRETRGPLEMTATLENLENQVLVVQLVEMEAQGLQVL